MVGTHRRPRRAACTLRPDTPEGERSGHPGHRVRFARAVAPGDLFVAMRGATADGHDYIEAALDLGAVALLLEEERAASVPVGVVDDTRRALAPIATRFFGNPASELDLIGITGTNGKTSTSLPGGVDPAGGRQGHRPDRDRRDALRGRTHPRRQHDPGEPRPPAHPARHAHGRRRSRRDGGLVARPRPRPRRGLPLPGRGRHERDPGPPRLPQGHGRLPRCQGAPVRRIHGAGRPRRDQHRRWRGPDLPRRRRTMRRAGDPREPGRFRPRRAPTPRRPLLASKEPRPASPFRTARPWTSALPLLGDFNLENLLVGLGVGVALDLPRDALAAGVARCPQVPGRMERVGAEIPGAPTSLVGLRAHAGRARQAAGRGPAAGDGPVDHGLRLRRRPGPGEAETADGARGVASQRPRDRDERQPADRGSGRDPARRLRGSGRPARCRRGGPRHRRAGAARPSSTVRRSHRAARSRSRRPRTRS